MYGTPRNMRHYETLGDLYIKHKNINETKLIPPLRDKGGLYMNKRKDLNKSIKISLLVQLQ